MIGKIPVGWSIKTVADICDKLQYGLTASANSSSDIGPKFLRITDITQSGVNWDKVPYCECQIDQIEKFRLFNNDILFARIGGTTGKSFIVKNPPQSVFASYLIRLRVLSGKDNPNYLYFYFQSPFYWQQINANKDNNLKGGVNASVLSELQIISPPLKEQQKIAAVLFKIQQAIEVQESIIEATQELKKSTMQHAFTYGLRGKKTKETEIGRMPESWEIQNISELGEIITGTTPSTKKAVYYQNGEYQFIAPADIGKTTRIYKSEKKITELGLSVSRILPKDTVCIVCIGSTIGKVGITTQSKSATNQQINSIIVTDKYEPFFITYLLTYLSEHIASFASSSPVPIISKGKFEKIQVMICNDKYEQQEIANLLKIIDKKIEFGISKKSALQDLFKTMLNKLMTGVIRVKDSDIDTSCVLEMENRG